ncbi:MAG: tetratricopeptide repeat protein [Burkholderiaceae bacterium]
MNRSGSRLLTMLGALLFVAACGLPLHAHAINAECLRGEDHFEQGATGPPWRNLDTCLGLIQPPDVEAYVLQMRAVAHHQLGEANEALRDQLAAHELDRPRTIWPYLMLATYYRELHCYELALDALAHARRLERKDAGGADGVAVRLHTGRTLMALGRYRDAITQFDEALAHGNEHVHALYYRALCREALGERKRARDDLQDVARLSPAEGFVEEEISLKLRGMA